MGMFGKKVKKESNQISTAPAAWDNWEPGNKKAAELSHSGEWLIDGFKRQKVEMPEVVSEKLDEISKIISEEVAKGSAESQLIKRLKSEVSLNSEDAKTVGHFGAHLAVTQSSLNDYLESNVTKVEWLGPCCELCDENEGISVPINTPFPTGHLYPPACEYCLCAISPSIDI